MAIATATQIRMEGAVRGRISKRLSVLGCSSKTFHG
jgi:hypothetical protein